MLISHLFFRCTSSTPLLTWYTADEGPRGWRGCPHWWPPDGSSRTAPADGSEGRVPDESSAAGSWLRPVSGRSWRVRRSCPSHCRLHCRSGCSTRSAPRTRAPTAAKTRLVRWTPSGGDCQLQKMERNDEKSGKKVSIRLEVEWTANPRDKCGRKSSMQTSCIPHAPCPSEIPSISIPSWLICFSIDFRLVRNSGKRVASGWWFGIGRCATHHPQAKWVNVHVVVLRQRQIKILRRPQIVGRKPSESMTQENVVLVVFGNSIN